ncbi:MAG: HAD family phosphatase [Ruminococcus sp.]|nr:HAD family phosphatase [Ruminococcus sp.]
MSSLAQIRAVILDLDGTLLDSMPLWHEIDLAFLRENGIEPPDNISDIVGKMSITEWAEYFIREFSMPHTPQQVIRRIEEMAETAYRETIPLKPHVTAFLDVLDGMGLPYGIATATYKNSAWAALRRLGLAERMQFVLTGEDVEGGKSTPEIYLRSAALLGSSPQETLVVEDALHCVQTAVSAGFLTAGVYDAAALPEEWQEMQRICTVSGEDLSEILEKIQ